MTAMTQAFAMSSFPSAKGTGSTHSEMQTNTLRVVFDAEAEVTVARAFQELGPFGEIARLEIAPGQQAAVVSYYDMRHAAKAAAVLKERAVEEQQYGEPTVWLTGDVQLLSWMIPEIAGVRQGGNDTYALDFFDTRSAERAGQSFRSASSTACSDAPPGLELPMSDVPPGLEMMQRELPSKSRASTDIGLGEPMKLTVGSAGSTSGPRYHNDLRLSEVNWADLDCGRDVRTTLRLRCLPAKLCEEEAFHQCLRRGGLTKMVDCVRIFPGEGRRPGSALVNAVNMAGVKAVTRYFHGRQWGKSMPVAVSFAAVQGSGEVQQAFPDKTFHTEATLAAQTAKAASEPWLIEATGCCEGENVSDASTEAGDDA